MSAANWASLKTYWQTQIAASSLTASEQLEALGLLDRWIDAENSRDTVAKSDISSYTAAGRTVSRRSSTEFSKVAADARQEFFARLFGNVTHADFRHSNAEDN